MLTLNKDSRKLCQTQEGQNNLLMSWWVAAVLVIYCSPSMDSAMIYLRFNLDTSSVIACGVIRYFRSERQTTKMFLIALLLRNPQIPRGPNSQERCLHVDNVCDNLILLTYYFCEKVYLYFQCCKTQAKCLGC